MSIEQAIEAVSQIAGTTVRTSEMMSRHTPLRIGGATDLWIHVDDLTALKSVLSHSQTKTALATSLAF